MLMLMPSYPFLTPLSPFHPHRCARPIEKNQGCMHMTCSQCRHEFCWLCEGPWAEHGERTGGYYNCNVFKRGREAGGADAAEAERARARASLERYMHFWQRWAEHDKARRTALGQLAAWEAPGGQLEALGERTATPPSQLRFVLDAWRGVVDCRRVLKWTYAAGFYWFDDLDAEAEARLSPEERAAAAARRTFFEFTQQDAEAALERMNHKVERRLPAFLRDDGEGEGEGAGGAGGGARQAVEPAEWAAFREELLGLTDVTRAQFAKLVDFLAAGLETGLAELAGGVDEAGGSGSGGVGGSGGGGAEAAAAGGAAAAAAAAEARTTRAAARRARGKGPAGAWECGGCGFANAGAGEEACEVCRRPRLADARLGGAPPPLCRTISD